MTFSCIRWTLESLGSLEPRKSALEEDFEEEEDKEENEQLDDEIEDEAHEKVSMSFLFKDSLSSIFVNVFKGFALVGTVFNLWILILLAGLLSWSKPCKGQRQG